MGVPDPEELYTFTHGNLRALIRRIPGTSTESKPDWAKREDKDLLAPLLFMRNINRSSDVDRAIVEQLAGFSYGNVDKAYAEIEENENKLLSAQKGIESGKEKLQEGKKQYEQGLKSYEDEIKAGELSI